MFIYIDLVKINLSWVLPFHKQYILNLTNKAEVT